MLLDFSAQFGRYRTIGERALAQLPDALLDRVPAPDGNSVGMIVRHLSGNLVSRFTDFLTTDGEKPWRDRDGEFEERAYTRAEVDAEWARGWAVLEATLASLTDADMACTVAIRGEAMTAHAALCRALAHVAYHVGQIVLLARQGADRPWQWISIPKVASAQAADVPPGEEGRR